MQQLTAAEPSPRLDRWLAAKARPTASRARWQKAIAGGAVRVNGAEAKASDPVQAGDTVEFRLVESAVPALSAAEEMALDIVFEDEHLLVVNKPAGLVVHPGAGNWEGTLVNGLLHHCRGLTAGHPSRPGIVHRLDKDTSGVILVAKSDDALTNLAAQFANRTAEKTYLAVVRGKPRTSAGTINGAIARHPIHRQRMTVSTREGARPAETGWRVLLSTGHLSLLECRPKTGRTHQIRVHLRHLGHPVAGDRTYGGGADFPRQLLHAWKIRLAHPATGESVAFEAPVPEDFPLRPEETAR
ncbi:MAG: RluA family pseudouridine synthase [Chthoniobacterales bacterium]